MAKFFIILGILFIIIGLGFYFGKKLGLGQLPGDFYWQHGNVTFFFPLATSLLISLILSLLFWLFR